jgi:hypothetical protein
MAVIPVRCREAWAALGNPEVPEGYLPPGCCVSCHEDEDEGYSALMDRTLPDGRLAEVCCHVAGLLDAAAAADPHQSTGPQSCSCGTPGFVSELACGHETWTHGEPADLGRPGGAWISCHTCQAQRRIVAVRPCPGA